MARPDNMSTTTPVDADKWPNRYVYSDNLDAIERVAELAETCRVLTELAQQLTNALGKIREDGALDNLELQDACDAYAALDAAAELGITPTPP